MSEVTRLRNENVELKRTKSQLAKDLGEEKDLVKGLMDTVRNYEKILRLEGSNNVLSNDISTKENSKEVVPLGIFCRSILLLDQEVVEMSRTVAYMLEKVRKTEKLYEHRERKLSNLSMRIERLDAVAFGKKIEC